MTIDIMIENLSNMIKEKIIECNLHLPYSEGVRPIGPTIFRAYKTDGKIIITKKDADEDEYIFCNYLKDEMEMNTFFDGISVESYIMDNSTFGTHYPYGENPKSESVKTSFSIYDDTIDKEIYFFEGRWNPQYEDVENGLVEDSSYNDREEIIRLYARMYLDDFFSEQTEDNTIEMMTEMMEGLGYENENKKDSDIIYNCSSEWKNREVAKNDIVSTIKENGYHPYIAEDRKGLTRILAICEHDKISNIGKYSIIDIQRKSKKKWEWNQDPEYYNSVTRDFVDDDFCHDCSERKESVVCDVKIIPERYNREAIDIQVKKANIFYDIKNGTQMTIDEAWNVSGKQNVEDQSSDTVKIESIQLQSEPIIEAIIKPIIDNSLNPNFLDQISSIHIFDSGKTIAKYPLNRKENIVFTIPPEILKEELKKFEESGKWRIIKVSGTFHAAKNPDGTIAFNIPKALDLSGKSIIFSETGEGKSTLLSYIGRQAVSKNQNVVTIESPRSLSIEDATRLDNNEKAVSTVLLCRPDLVLFDEVRDGKHFSQLKQLSLACPHIIGSFHATEIFEALARFSSLNGSRRYGEVSTIVDKFIHVQKGEIVNWYTLNTTLSSKLNGEFLCDGERPVTEIRDKNNSVIGWLFYFARDINIVKNKTSLSAKKNSKVL